MKFSDLLSLWPFAVVLLIGLGVLYWDYRRQLTEWETEMRRRQQNARRARSFRQS